MKLLHYIDGNLSEKHSDINVKKIKKHKKYEFLLDNIMNYIYITDRLVFKRETDEYIVEINICDKSSCKIYLKNENQELNINVISSSYEENVKYIDFKYILETDNKEHHIILEIGDYIESNQSPNKYELIGNCKLK